MHSSKLPVYHNEEEEWCRGREEQPWRTKEKKKRRENFLSYYCLCSPLMWNWVQEIIELQCNNYWANEGRQAIAIFLEFSSFPFLKILKIIGKQSGLFINTDYTSQTSTAKQGEWKKLFAWDLETFKGKASLKKTVLYTTRANFTAYC